MLHSKIYLILGIGTDIGKTFFIENLCRKIPTARAIKPIVSGILDDDLNSDSAKILAAMNLKLTKENLDKISPWRFEMPVSPHFAGEINYNDLLKFCRKEIANTHNANNDFLFIESAGGVMSPINNEKTFLDLARDLKIPIILISSNYLGAISHSLTAIEVLKKNNIFIEKIVLNENFPSKIENIKIAQTISSFSQVEVIEMSKFLNQI